MHLLDSEYLLETGPSSRARSIRPRSRILFAVASLIALVCGGILLSIEYDIPEVLPAYKHRYLPFHNPSTNEASGEEDLVLLAAPHVDWSRFAYTQYTTDLSYLCNSLMLFARLNELGCRGDRLLMHPENWVVGDGSETGRLLQDAQELYDVKLQPVKIQRRNWADSTWAESYTKQLAVNQTQYDRVLSLDSDSVVLQCLDELFLSPSAPFAMPRAYWLWADHPELSDQLLLAEPNAQELDRIMYAIETADEHTFDMDIMNDLYLSNAMVLPHRDYDLVTGEFRTETGAKNHGDYLGNDYERWRPWEILRQAKFLHFSDWPVPKPWLPIHQYQLRSRGPNCVSPEDCEDRDLWYAVYGDFKRRRMEVCGFQDWGGDIQSATLSLDL